jgi:predicted nucleic acid-binding protein
VTVTVDINVFLDVFQLRQPHYLASAHIVSLVETGALDGVCPAHGLTTLYYVVRKHASKQDAESAMDRVLDHFRIGNLDVAGWKDARSLPFNDFEDAAVAAVAQATASAFIITRDVAGFTGSRVPAISPADYVNRFATRP